MPQNPPSTPALGRLVASVATLSLAPLGLAQEANQASSKEAETITLSTFTVSTTQDKGYQAGNSVSATRINTAIKDLPFAVSAFTEQFIADIGTKDLTDVLKFAPSVTSGSEGFSSGNAFTMVRGFQSLPQRNGFYSPLYVDGSVIQRVEVVKGPASLFYGQIAPGGVVNYITKRPGSRAFGNISGQVGSYGYARGQIDVNQPLASDRAFVRVNTAWEKIDTYVDKVEGDILSLNPSFLLKVTDNSDLIVEYNWYRREETPHSLMRQSILIPLPTFNYFGHYAIDDRRYNAGSIYDFKNTDLEVLTAEYQIRHSADWTTRFVFDWNKSQQKMKQTGRGDVTIFLPASFLAQVPTTFKEGSIWLNENLPEDISTLATGSSLVRRMRYEANYTQRRTYMVESTGKVTLGGLIWKPLVGGTFNSGVSQLYQATQATALWGKAWNIFDRSTWSDVDSPHTSWPVGNDSWGFFENTGLYSANQFSLLDERLLMVGGLRWSQSKANSYNQISKYQSPNFKTERTTPQFGVGYKIRSDLMLYGSYSESFIAANSMLTTKGVADRVAQPFIGTGYEFGVKTDLLNGRFSGNLSYFINEQENYIFSFVEILNGQTVHTQVQDGNVVQSEGFEAEFTYSPTDHWQIYFGASYTPTEYSSISSPDVQYLLGTPTQYSAKNRANLWTRYSFDKTGWKGLWVAGGFNYTGEKAEISNNPWLMLPAQTVFDAVIGYDWKVGTRNWSTKLTWKNITDEDEIMTVRERGQPSRLIAEVSLKF